MMKNRLWRTVALSVFALSILFAHCIGLSAPAERKNPASVKHPAKAHGEMIWDYQKELELSPNQVKGIRTAVTDYRQKILDLDKKLRTVEAELRNLVHSKGDLDAIRSKIEESATINAQELYLDIKTARDIDGMMSPSQQKMWKQIQERENAKSVPVSPRKKKPVSE